MSVSRGLRFFGGVVVGSCRFRVYMFFVLVFVDIGEV